MDRRQSLRHLPLHSCSFLLHAALGVVAALVMLSGPALAGEKKPPEDAGDKARPAEDPSLVGEVVSEKSEYENLLFTEYRKRRTAHFFFETSYDMDACKDYIAFLEQQYRDFLKWAGKPADTDLWGTRAHAVLVHNKAEWEALMTQMTRGQPPHVVEALKNGSGTHQASPPALVAYSSAGSDPLNDKMLMFHNLNHLFLYGLAGAGGEALLPWLFEAFSWHRSFEVFGHQGSSCMGFGTVVGRDDDRAWNDVDDWVALLQRDAALKQDEDFTLFWHKDLTSIATKTYVKSWSIVRYLLRDEKEKAKLVSFVSMLKSKPDQARALKETCSVTGEELDKDWRVWIRKQPSRWRKE